MPEEEHWHWHDEQGNCLGDTSSLDDACEVAARVESLITIIGASHCFDVCMQWSK